MNEMNTNQKAKELEIQGCRTFVCPNLSSLDEKCKGLDLKNETIKRAKDMAIEYFRKTYRMPHYSSAKHVLPAFVYIASILEGEKRSKKNVSKIFGTSELTIKRWYRDIMKTLNIETLRDERKFEMSDFDIKSKFADEIDKEGKVLLLKDKTIERAKDLAFRYLEIVNLDHYCLHTTQLIPAFVYMASVIENDRRTQMEIGKVSGVSEPTISKWYNDIIRNFGMKIIAHGEHVIAVIEGKEIDD